MINLMIMPRSYRSCCQCRYGYHDSNEWLYVLINIICVDTKKIVGMITLEDVIEELIQEEILDEDDLAHVYDEKAAQAIAEAKKYHRGLNVRSPNRHRSEKAPLIRAPYSGSPSVKIDINTKGIQ